MEEKLCFKFEKAKDITVESKKFLPFIRKELPELKFTEDKINVLLALRRIDTKKILNFMADELSILLPPSAEKELYGVNTVESLGIGPRLEDDLEIEHENLTHNLGSENQGGKYNFSNELPTWSQTKNSKHCSKMTRDELEQELATFGIPYVYARTKDAADALAKLKDGTLKVNATTPLENSLNTLSKLERAFWRTKNQQTLEDELRKSNAQNAETSKLYPDKNAILNPFEIDNQYAFQDSFGETQQMATIGLGIAETRQKLSQTRQEVGEIHREIAQLKETVERSLEANKKQGDQLSQMKNRRPEWYEMDQLGSQYSRPLPQNPFYHERRPRIETHYTQCPEEMIKKAYDFPRFTYPRNFDNPFANQPSIYVKPPKLGTPEFKKEEPIEFLKQIERYAEIAGWDEYHKKICLAAALEKANVLWYINNRAYLGALSFEEFKKKFVKEFKETTNLGNDLLEFQNKVQREDENGREYLEKKLYLASTIRDRLTDKELIEIIISGFRPEMAEKVYLLQNETIEQLRENVRKVEQAKTIGKPTQKPSVQSNIVQKTSDLESKLDELSRLIKNIQLEKQVNAVKETNQYSDRNREENGHRSRYYDGYGENENNFSKNRADRSHDRNFRGRSKSPKSPYRRESRDGYYSQGYHREGRKNEREDRYQSRNRSIDRKNRDVRRRSYSRDRYVDENERRKDNRDAQDRSRSRDRYSGAGWRARSPTPGRDQTSRNRSRTPSGRPICDYCTKPGHYSRTCLKKAYDMGIRDAEN